MFQTLPIHAVSHSILTLREGAVWAKMLWIFMPNGTMPLNSSTVICMCKVSFQTAAESIANHEKSPH